MKPLMGFEGANIESLQKKGKLSGTDFHHLLGILRPLEPVFFQPLLPKCETVAVPVKHFQGGFLAIAEHKKVTGEGIHLQRRLHQDRKSIDRLSHVGSAGGEKHSGMSGDGNHRLSRNPSSRSRASASKPFSISSR